MPSSRSRTLSYLAAALLTLLTLSTFYLLRNYGPEWAIRRFHEALEKQPIDGVEIAQVSVEPPDSRDMEKLESIVKASQSFDIESVSQGPGEATFDIRYYLRGQKLDVNWAVEQRREGWLINGKRTLDQSPDLEG